MAETSEGECIDALERAAETLGESPTKAQYEALGFTPASATIINQFGGWNAAKAAADLETFAQGGGGTPIDPKPPDVDLPEDTEWRDLSSNQRWYYKNRRRDIDQKEYRKARIKRWLFEYKRDKLEGERCGESDPAVLDFHHTDEKDMGVARMVNHGYSKESILAEIETCVVLCANCHRKHHFEEPPVPEDPASQHS